MHTLPDTPSEVLERLRWLNYMLKEDRVTRESPLNDFNMKVLQNTEAILEELISHIEGIESERNQYLKWFEINDIAINDVLNDLYEPEE